MTQEINFSKHDGLVPVIIQHAKTSIVLMLGFMNEAAFQQTCAEKKVTFFSRTKNRLWTKGESSGNFLIVIDIKLDCDQDTLLIKVLPQGNTCHTGAYTCFQEKAIELEKGNPLDFLHQLEGVITQRKNSEDTNSYVRSLFENGINKIAQKVGEEAIETVIEAKDNNAEKFLNESADLLFHYLILLQAKGFVLEDILKILQSRHK